jgi:hypothetical protein
MSSATRHHKSPPEATLQLSYWLRRSDLNDFVEAHSAIYHCMRMTARFQPVGKTVHLPPFALRGRPHSEVRRFVQETTPVPSSGATGLADWLSQRELIIYRHSTALSIDFGEARANFHFRVSRMRMTTSKLQKCQLIHIGRGRTLRPKFFL